MSDSYAHAARRRANRGDRPATLLSTVRDLWPYIWPADRVDLKARALGAVGILLAAKLVTMAVPYAFKWATDALAPGARLDDVPLPGWMLGAVALTVLYGALRILMALLTQGGTPCSRRWR